MATVLLTNAQLRKTLAAVRSLGKRNVKTIVVEETRFSPTAFSKYCTKALVCPNPKEHPDEFLRYISGIIQDYQCDVLFPMDEDTMAIAIKYRNELSKICRLPVPPTDSYEIAADKGAAYKHASQVGVDHPKTIYPENMDAINELAAGLQYPVIVKPVKSSGGRGIVKVENSNALVQIYKQVHAKYPFPIIQEYLGQGEVYEAVLLFNQQSELKASFVQKHVRKFPLEYGPSVVQESVFYPEILEKALDFMKGLNWYGIASLEFMVRKDTGEIKFIEINPRLWNSLQMGILAGVDFPWLMYQIAMMEDFPEVKTYVTGLRCRNLLPSDILHFIVNRDRMNMNPPFWGGKKQNMYDDIISKKDPMPVLGFILACLRYSFDIKMWKFLLRI